MVSARAGIQHIDNCHRGASQDAGSPRPRAGAAPARRDWDRGRPGPWSTGSGNEPSCNSTTPPGASPPAKSAARHLALTTYRPEQLHAGTYDDSDLDYLLAAEQTGRHTSTTAAAGSRRRRLPPSFMRNRSRSPTVGFYHEHRPAHSSGRTIRCRGYCGRARSGVARGLQTSPAGRGPGGS